jgi:hypothetical protein
MKRFQHEKGALTGGPGFSVQKVLVLILALAVLSGASVWEGAAALAPRGELPEDGYYVATNSFPQNTVVDITNLETGKSVRAIVSSGLNTPGLLAILSADTASRIGLSVKTIGRIRMTQPEDPIAFSRFTEGLVVSGDPDYNPEAMLAGDAREQEELEQGIPPAGPEGPAEASRGTNAPAYGSEIPRGIEYPDYADYSHGSIVDVQGDSPPAPPPEAQAADDWEDDWNGQAYPGYPAEDGESVEKTIYPIWEQGGSVGKLSAAQPSPQPPAPQESLAPQEPSAPQEASGPQEPPVPLESSALQEPPGPEKPEDLWEDAWKETGTSQAQGEIPGQGRILAEAASAADAGGNQSRAAARILVQPPLPGTVDYALIPAEERPPAAPPLTEQVPPGPAPAPGEALDQSLFIEPIEKQREARAAEAARAAEEAGIAGAAVPVPPAALAKTPEGEPQGPWVEPIAPAPKAVPPEVVVTGPGEAQDPRAEPEAPSPAPPRQAGGEPEIFSVPVKVIDELEKGKYYVQLGAYRSAASVESALLKIDPGYPLSVQNAGTGDNPVYRLLVGPLNLGESGALVRRFKGSGYRDAYVRAD